MLRNLDGTPYQLSGTLQQFNSDNPEYDLFNQWDQEAIQRGGSPLYYYEVLIQPQTVDPLYLEDRGKLFSPNPITIWANYEPIPSQNALTAFGIDAPDEIVFECNYQAILNAIGHPPKIGSRIFSPHLRENWTIMQRNLGEFKMWGVLRLELICQRFQESLSNNDGKVTDNEPDVKIKII